MIDQGHLKPGRGEGGGGDVLGQVRPGQTQELSLGGEGKVRPVMAVWQPGVLMDLLCYLLQLPRSCPRLGPTEEIPRKAPGPRICDSMWVESRQTPLKCPLSAGRPHGVSWISDSLCCSHPDAALGHQLLP